MTETTTDPAQQEAPAIDLNDPAAVEQAIVDIHRFMAQGVKEIGSLNAEHKRLARLLDEEFAVAYLAHPGPQTEKRQAATLKTMDRRQEVDEAKVLLDYARDQMRALEKQMSGLQSILSDLRAMFGAERGRG